MHFIDALVLLLHLKFIHTLKNKNPQGSHALGVFTYVHCWTPKTQLNYCATSFLSIYHFQSK
ncbi:hypothetical protein MCP1_740005 [Candidatus Terasakiella magnetica]|nr:hypothetical protein MCP1_740005 [Candidatus Terasakiella magnetica]